jgi:hypothetical protein
LRRMSCILHDVSIERSKEQPMKDNTASAAGGAMPAPANKPETYASGFLRLMALRQAIEKTLGEMAVLLDVDTPEPVAIAVRTIAVPYGDGQSWRA